MSTHVCVLYTHGCLPWTWTLTNSRILLSISPFILSAYHSSGHYFFRLFLKVSFITWTTFTHYYVKILNCSGQCWRSPSMIHKFNSWLSSWIIHCFSHGFCLLHLNFRCTLCSHWLCGYSRLVRNTSLFRVLRFFNRVLSASTYNSPTLCICLSIPPERSAGMSGPARPATPKGPNTAPGPKGTPLAPKGPTRARRGLNANLLKKRPAKGTPGSEEANSGWAPSGPPEPWRDPPCPEGTPMRI